MQQATVERRAGHLDALGEHEAALELTRRDAAVEEHPLGLVAGDAPGDGELVGFERHREVRLGKPGDREGDAQAVLGHLFDVVRGIAFRRGLGYPVEHPLEVVEPEQQRAVEGT